MKFVNLHEKTTLSYLIVCQSEIAVADLNYSAGKGLTYTVPGQGLDLQGH